MKRRLAVVAAVLLASTGLSITSASATSRAAASLSQRRNDAISKVLTQMTAAGDSWTRIRAQVSSMGVTGLPIADPAELSPHAGPGIRPDHSYNSDVTMTRTFGYYDVQAHEYAAVAEYSWDNTTYQSDAAKSCWYGTQTPCELGGNDAFALRLRSHVTVDSTSAIFCTNGDGCGSPQKNPWTVNQYGDSYSLQDVIFDGGKLNMYSGTVSLRTPSIGCSNQIFSQLTHTWSSSHLSGIGVSSTGFSLSGATSSYLWSAAGHSTGSVC